MSSKLFRYQDKQFEVELNVQEGTNVVAVIDGDQLAAAIQKINPNTFSISQNGKLFSTHVAMAENQIFVSVNGEQYVFEQVEEKGHGHRPGIDAASETGNEINAPMPGKILKFFVEEGQKFKKNDRLFIVEAMKMENEVRAGRAGVVKKIHFQENDLVSVGDPVIEIES